MSAVTMSAKAELPDPFCPSDLAQFFETVPHHARVSITVHVGGSQRDPYPTGYLVRAEWEAQR